MPESAVGVIAAPVGVDPGPGREQRCPRWALGVELHLDPLGRKPLLLGRQAAERAEARRVGREASSCGAQPAVVHHCNHGGVEQRLADQVEQGEGTRDDRETATGRPPTWFTVAASGPVPTISTGTKRTLVILGKQLLNGLPPLLILRPWVAGTAGRCAISRPAGPGAAPPCSATIRARLFKHLPMAFELIADPLGEMYDTKVL